MASAGTPTAAALTSPSTITCACTNHCYIDECCPIRVLIASGGCQAHLTMCCFECRPWSAMRLLLAWKDMVLCSWPSPASYLEFWLVPGASA